MRAPCSGRASAYSRRSSIRPGISCSARRISLRPNSASARSATAKSIPLRSANAAGRVGSGVGGWRSWVQPPGRARARGSMGPDDPGAGTRSMRHAASTMSGGALRNGTAGRAWRTFGPLQRLSDPGRSCPSRIARAPPPVKPRSAHRSGRRPRRARPESFLNAAAARPVLCSASRATALDATGGRSTRERRMRRRRRTVRGCGRWSPCWHWPPGCARPARPGGPGAGRARRRRHPPPAGAQAARQRGARAGSDRATSQRRPGSAAACPTELVGSWSADDPQGVGSWTIAFAADGRYDQSNPRRGSPSAARPRWRGAKLYLQPQDADSQTFVWQVSGGPPAPGRPRLPADGRRRGRAAGRVVDRRGPAPGRR